MNIVEKGRDNETDMEKVNVRGGQGSSSQQKASSLNLA